MQTRAQVVIPRGGSFLREVLPTPLAGDMALDSMPPFYISSSCTVSGWAASEVSFCFDESGNKRRCEALFGPDDPARVTCYCGALGGSLAECVSGDAALGAYTVGRELLNRCREDGVLSHPSTS